MNRKLLITTALIILTGLLTQFCTDVSEQNSAEGELRGASAHWVSSDRVIWNTTEPADRFELRYSMDADIEITQDGVQGGESITLNSGAELNEHQTDKYRHISGWPVYSLESDRELVQNAIRGLIVAVSYDADGNVVEATRVQAPGVIDEFFSFDGVLGPVYDGDVIRLNVWAPTAQAITLKTYGADKEHQLTIEADSYDVETGVWQFSGEKAQLDRAFYRLDMQVFHHENMEINSYEVTDPYSLSLSTDSYFSQFADLYNDSDLKPSGWDNMRKELPRATDITLYEAHVRDFSALDMSIPYVDRGTFMAFTHNGENGRELSDGMAHLKALQEAGLTHLHLLPVNDITTVIEDRERRVDIDQPYSDLCELMDYQEELQPYCERFGDTPIYEAFAELASENPATESIQLPYSLRGRFDSIAHYDGFNWGYDPFHFNAIEGSYSTDPDGVQRIIEFREMVKALDEIGLKLVVDVVYNHTSAHGLTRRSVLDRVVPGYYQRYDMITGEIETSTCCPNTAAEHYMKERLIIDSIVFWAKHYKVDSFRFDLMGHHPRYVMERLQDALAELTLEEHGVDGANIYIYGEGWNFGEVADNRIFDQATQFEMNGTGIGNFNDRKRDGIRGRNFTDTGRFQGFTSGQYLFPNEEAGNDSGQQLADLLFQADQIRVGMTGNLRSYPYINRDGNSVVGFDDMIGFTDLPQESINYIDKHDNETLWDNTQTKLPMNMSTDDRVRVHMLSLAMINYGQGIPFHQMGSDFLRSKSLDRNSFDSGDWFNQVDFTMETHNWGRGLPPAWDNQNNWERQAEFLRNDNSRPEKHHMELSHEIFKDQLRVRYSSPLFRLDTAEDVNRRVMFHNTGPDQKPGIIAMTVSDGSCAGDPLDSELDGMLIIFNSHVESQEFDSGINGLELHPMLKNGADEVVKTASVSESGLITLPALTAAVFIKKTAGHQAEFVCNVIE